MAERIGKTKPVTSFEYELFEGDPDHLRTVVATPTPAGPWIDPGSLKIKYRVGRGPFGDVSFATHHQSSHDFDRNHELAVKVLHPLDKDHTQEFLDKFEELFYKCREFCSVCWLHGISIIEGKVNVVQINLDFSSSVYLYFHTAHLDSCFLDDVSAYSDNLLADLHCYESL